MEQQNKIQILAPDIANKIAAGEVVERPASIVKELVENAIDADARMITIVLKNGGCELVQVVDDGLGMHAGDLELAFQRHATSKIRTADDLAAIRTLGFRGEALASIASVSRVEAKSIERDETEGIAITLEGGKIVDARPAGGTSGTTIAVKTLFFNTPARRKFLRSQTTEYRHCLEVANRFALSYPDKGFTLVHNGEVIWDLRPEDTVDRICAILGNRLRQALLLVIDDTGAVRIRGFVGNQDTVRRNRGEQYLFLNGRYITDRSLNHAVVSAYGEILAHGGYPFYVLELEVDPTRVDVNVHPTKMEVKFADDRLIYSLVQGAVRRSLLSARIIPDLQQRGSSVQQQSSQDWLRNEWPDRASSVAGNLDNVRLDRFGGVQANLTVPADSPAEQQLRLPMTPEKNADDDSWLSVPPAPARDTKEASGFAPGNVWQLHNRYILSQVKSGLIIIDQHIAHERILYEQALRQFKDSTPSSQKLLFPFMLELSAEDFAVLQEILPFLEKLGFSLGEFGRQTMVIEGVPSGLRVKNYQKIVTDIIDDYKRGKRDNLEIRDNVAKSFSCHTAIRSGDPLTVAEMNALLDQLFQAETPYFCPHGRPVLVNLPLEELDKRFGRI